MAEVTTQIFVQEGVVVWVGNSSVYSNAIGLKGMVFRDRPTDIRAQNRILNWPWRPVRLFEPTCVKWAWPKKKMKAQKRAYDPRARWIRWTQKHGSEKALYKWHWHHSGGNLLEPIISARQFLSLTDTLSFPLTLLFSTLCNPSKTLPLFPIL